MFDALTDRLSGVFDGLTGKGSLSEKDVSSALREIRVALLEADVALDVVKQFIADIKPKAVGEDVIRSVKPGQQVIKIVNDGLVEMLGGNEEAQGLRIDNIPAVIMMAGLQGSGKTTTTGKLARRLKNHDRKKVLMASLDVYRPAAMHQLKVLGEQIEVDTLPITDGQMPVDIAKRAVNAAKLGGYDVVILDTAGRTTLDEQMMGEAAQVAEFANPAETILVADALTGQDAVETARRFNDRLKLTGLILTRMDGDGRGGAALSMRAVTGLPIKFLGTGEKSDGLEVFDARRIAGRILGQGDVVSLVERAAAELDEEKTKRMAEKMAKGVFDLEDMAEQFRQLQRMGGLGGIMGMMPGAKKAKAAMDSQGLDDKVIKRQEAIILSMTPKERAKPALLNASRKKRVAAGAGVHVSEVNKVLKMHKQMAGMMKKMGKGGMKQMAKAMGAMGQGGVPGGQAMDSAALQDMAGKMGSGLPGLGGPGGMPGGMGGLPGLGGPRGGKKK
ncbi:signal recognition particle protein [Hirschia baltica]|uniref:Signal recognition particle protein n=1 Tax=Hirschia baltica (strain ATCC 49814 / DSM 5838 / IFAM 1418) TaxID=582402 RepID=C6XN42_HIRBI|nr:signal recognition particle protein [Hirschia baltica]ACT58212.1 signal recognition particle protein [Hirschia baltica ATCC 49814]